MSRGKIGRLRWQKLAGFWTQLTCEHGQQAVGYLTLDGEQIPDIGFDVFSTYVTAALRIYQTVHDLITGEVPASFHHQADAQLLLRIANRAHILGAHFARGDNFHAILLADLGEASGQQVGQSAAEDLVFAISANGFEGENRDYARRDGQSR